MMQQIERIQTMEQAMTASEQALTALGEALEQYRAVLPQLNALKEYYFSPQWRQDYADDAAGNIPKDLPRGVLSEDGVFNLITEQNELMDDLRTLAAQHQK